MLGRQFIQLALLQLLAECAKSKAENGHGGAKTKSLLESPGRTHFVVAQADSESTLAWACGTLSTGPFIAAKTIGLAFGGNWRGSAFGHDAMRIQAQV
jgi:hypothetical protein